MNKSISQKHTLIAAIGVAVLLMIGIMVVVVQCGAFRSHDAGITAIPSPDPESSQPDVNTSEASTSDSPNPDAIPYDPQAIERETRAEVLEALQNYVGLGRDAAEQRLRQAETVAEHYGLPAWVGQFMAKDAAIMTKIRQNDRKSARYYYSVPDQSEMQNTMILNFAQNVQTSSGVRISLLELLMQNRGRIDQEMEIRETFSKTIVSGVSTKELDQYIKNEFDVSVPDMIQAMGGPVGILHLIDPSRRYSLISFVSDPGHFAHIQRILMPNEK